MVKNMRNYFISIQFLLIIVLSVLLFGCTGPDGSVYQKYSWVSAPQYLYDTNPNLPSTIVNGTYYRVTDGNYYMEYTAWDGSSWYLYYWIKSDKGAPLFIPGRDAWVEIALYSFGPSIYNWSYARQMIEEDQIIDFSNENFDQSLGILINIKSDKNFDKGPIEIRKTYQFGDVRIDVESGRLVERY